MLNIETMRFQIRTRNRPGPLLSMTYRNAQTKAYTMAKKTYRVLPFDAPINGEALFMIAGPRASVRMAKDFAKQPDGDYAVRDCLGGLRGRIRVTDGAAKVMEWTK